MFTKLGTIIFALCIFLAFGCGKEIKASEKPDNANVPPSNTNAKTVKKSDVVKIVFVGQKDACECTRTRIDTTWNTLQEVLDGRDDISVERIQLDVEEEQADKLDDLRSMMVAPGIYFFDENEHLLEMLQGEVAPEQISKIL